jgi:hypothetical protein
VRFFNGSSGRLSTPIAQRRVKRTEVRQSMVFKLCDLREILSDLRPAFKPTGYFDLTCGIGRGESCFPPCCLSRHRKR